MEFSVGGSAGSGDVTCVGWNLRMNENKLQHGNEDNRQGLSPSNARSDQDNPLDHIDHIIKVRWHYADTG
jgi:hypothetical protein